MCANFKRVAWLCFTLLKVFIRIGRSILISSTKPDAILKTSTLYNADTIELRITEPGISNCFPEF